MSKEKENKKDQVSKSKKNVSKNNLKEDKKSLWVRFRIFCHGVKSEFLKVRWTTKKELVKYSVSTISFIVFCSLFFYLINVLFALVQSLI